MQVSLTNEPLGGPCLVCALHLQAKYREALAAGLDAERAVEATFGLVSASLYLGRKYGHTHGLHRVHPGHQQPHSHSHSHPQTHDSNLQATSAAACCLWAHRRSACRVGQTCSGSCYSRHLTSCWASQAMCSRCSRLWQMLTMQACRPISRWAGSMSDTLLLLGRLCLIHCAWEVTQAWSECFCLLDGARLHTPVRVAHCGFGSGVFVVLPCIIHPGPCCSRQQ